ncbi:MAG: outer membrane protein assembly factor BamC [Burkholderiaceae bacterium]|nr:outer membrane protein assembly factor BamC [Burkholderiaceae bacterium]
MVFRCKSRLARARAASLSLVGLALVVSGCSLTETIEEKSRVDYKSTAPIVRERLDVPPDLVAPKTDGRFDGITASSPKTASGFNRSERAPAALAAGATPVLRPIRGAELRREGNQRWMVVQEDPAKLWPKIRDFWVENGFVIARESPETGILDTDWAENRAKLPQDFIRRTLGKVIDGLYSTGERDRFRTRLEKTAAGTEVYVTHRGMLEVYADGDKTQTIWQPRPSDPELEIEMLRRMMVKLGVDEQQAAKASVRETIPAGARVSVLSDTAAGGKELKVPEGFERAWRRVGLALDRGGFAVEDRDRSKGVYYVRYIDPDSDARRADPGLLSKIFGARNPAIEQTEVYQILVSPAGENSVVKVLTKDGKAVAANDRATAGRMLALLQEQLKP